MLYILIVDDEPINLMLLKLLLETNPLYDIEEANNGKKAIDILLEHQKDIVLMDINMPIMNGAEATKYIREHISKDIPIIALTAYDRSSFLEKYVNAGFTEYFPKPIDKNELIKIINKYTKNSFLS